MVAFYLRAKLLLSHLVESEVQQSGKTGRVKAQWERVLSGTSREYLEQVHEETLFGRREISDQNTANTSTLVCDEVGFEISSGGNNSARDDRLNKIKQLQEKKRQAKLSQAKSESEA
jgi:hypothetical protein